MPFAVDQAAGVMVIGEGGYFAARSGATRRTPRTSSGRSSRPPSRTADRPPTGCASPAPTTRPRSWPVRQGHRGRRRDRRTRRGPCWTRSGPRPVLRRPVRPGQDDPRPPARPARFRYDTDVSDEDCADISIVECFATHQARVSASTTPRRWPSCCARWAFRRASWRGSCRVMRDLASGTSLVRNSDAHAWVQVYFPGYGWVDFDPTGGPGPGWLHCRQDDPRRARARVLRAVPGSASPGDPAARPAARRQLHRGPRTPGAARAADRRRDPARRRHRGCGRRGMAPGTARSGVGGRDVRCGRPAWRRGSGYAPRPNQTVYEYAGSLGDALPTVRPELETVARAKVEVAYGARVLTDDRMRSLREAHRRLRVGLLRLVVRRVRRSRSR